MAHPRRPAVAAQKRWFLHPYSRVGHHGMGQVLAWPRWLTRVSYIPISLLCGTPHAYPGLSLLAQTMKIFKK